MKKHLEEVKRLQKIAGIITENTGKRITEDDDDDKLDLDDLGNKFANMFSPNPHPPVWKSVLAADKKMLDLIDKEIKKLYPGAEKLPDHGDPIWATDKEAETTIPIAIYSWQDPNKPKEVEGDPGAIIPEDPKEAQEFFDQYDGPGDLIPWVTQIAVQKDVDSGDIAYYEILVSGETDDPYGEPTGFLTGKYAKDSTFNIATKTGLPKGTPGTFNFDNKYGDRTNE